MGSQVKKVRNHEYTAASSDIQVKVRSDQTRDKYFIIVALYVPSQI